MTTIALNEPTLPFDINQYYEEFLLGLSDGIYDKSRIAVPNSKPQVGPNLVSATPLIDLSGILFPGVYYYVITAKTPVGETLVSRELKVIVGPATDAVDLVWLAYPGATSYTIYRTTTSGDYRNCVVVTLNALTYRDLGSATQLGIPAGQFVKLTGTFAPAGIYLATLMLRNATGQFAQVQQKTTNPDGTFEFDVAVPIGSNAMFVTDGVVNSAIVYVNSYNLHLYFDMIANELKTFWQEITEQVYANVHLFLTHDLFDANSRLSTPQALANFWQVMTSVVRPSAFIESQYRAFLVAIIRAYRNATSFAAIQGVLQAIIPGWDKNNFIPVDVYNSGIKLGTNGKFFNRIDAELGALWPQIRVGAAFGPLRNMQYTVFNGAMFIVGGVDNTGTVVGNVYSSVDGITWNLITNAPAFGQRAFGALVVKDGFMYLIGGSDNIGVKNDVWKSADGNTWIPVTAGAAFSARNSINACVFNDRIWMTGGFDGGVTYFQEIWASTDGATWVKYPTPPWPAKGLHGQAVFKGQIFVAGGFDGVNQLQDVYSTFDGVNWTHQPDMPVFPEAEFGFLVQDNRLWILGGDSGTGQHGATYASRDGANWDQISINVIIMKRFSFASFAYNGILYVAGGIDNTATTRDDVLDSAQVIFNPGVRWFGENVVVQGVRGYYLPNGYTIPSEPGVNRVLFFYLDGTRTNGYFNVQVLEVPYATPLVVTGLPNDTLVLAAVRVENDVVKHIAGQGRIASLGSPYTGNSGGPFLCGPTYVNDRARMRGRGYKYSRMFVYAAGLNPLDPDYAVFVTMLKEILHEVKPAKMTIWLGVPPNTTYTQI